MLRFFFALFATSRIETVDVLNARLCVPYVFYIVCSSSLCCLYEMVDEKKTRLGKDIIIFFVWYVYNFSFTLLTGCPSKNDSLTLLYVT